MDEYGRPVFVIRIAADMLGLHPQTLRIWEHAGLVTPARRSNQRLYSNADIEFIRKIRYMTEVMGLNLAGVSLLLKLEAAGRFDFDEIVALADGRDISVYEASSEGTPEPTTDKEA
jgi:DNA-binding transcriptional MerR regulator